jgi:signal transduction histidine kinase
VVAVGELPVMPGSRAQIEQLFFHLMNNAITFSSRGVPLKIAITAERISSDRAKSLGLRTTQDDYCQITISDNGIGIEKSQLEKIFDIFSQVKHYPTTDGFGIGLSACRRIVNNHKGLIKATSTPGKGASFTIHFPIPTGAGLKVTPEMTKTLTAH